MASRHFSFKNGKVGKGFSHAKYIGGEGKYLDRGDVVLLVDANLPKWAADGADFFRAADQLERKNGRAYSELEFAIPREIADPAEFAREYAERLLGKRHPFRLAVHDKEASDGGRNIHAHLMFTERKLDGHERGREQFFSRANSKHPDKGGTAKDRMWNDRTVVQTLRTTFEKFAKSKGVALDLRSNAAQGLGEPEPKLGPDHPRAKLNKNRAARAGLVSAIRQGRKRPIRPISAPAVKPLPETKPPLPPIQPPAPVPKPPKTTVEAFLASGAYLGEDGKKYTLQGRLQPGQQISGKVVGHVDLAEGKFSLVHAGRGAVKLVEGILAEVGQLVEGVLKAAGFAHKGKSGHGIER